MNVIRLTFIGVILIGALSCFPAWAQNANELRIGFELPTDDRQADAAHLVAAALTKRNVEIQACANGADKTMCERNAEIAFRLDVSHIPGVRFKLSYDKTPNAPECNTLMDLKPDEVTSPDIDQNFGHIDQPGRYKSIGVHVDASNECFLKDSDGSTVDPRKVGFVRLVCELIKVEADANTMFRRLLRTEDPDLGDIAFLLDHGADINAKDLEYYAGFRIYQTDHWIALPAMHWVTAIVAAIQFQHQNCVRLLLDRGADVNAPSSQTALVEAVEIGDKEVVELLLDHGANVGATNSEGRMALTVACQRCNADLVRLLIDRGADVNAMDPGKGLNALMSAAQDNRVVVRTIVRGNDDVKSESRGFRADVLRLLLDLGADVNATNADGMTALMMARTVDAANLLLDHGASVNAADSAGRTALMYQIDVLDVAKVLLDHGASVSAKDHSGRAALDWSLEYKDYKEVSELLRQHGAKP